MWSADFIISLLRHFPAICSAAIQLLLAWQPFQQPYKHISNSSFNSEYSLYRFLYLSLFDFELFFFLRRCTLKLLHEPYILVIRFERFYLGFYTIIFSDLHPLLRVPSITFLHIVFHFDMERRLLINFQFKITEIKYVITTTMYATSTLFSWLINGLVSWKLPNFIGGSVSGTGHP